MFGIGGCEEVWSSIFWAQRRGKREHQMKGCVCHTEDNTHHKSSTMLSALVICHLLRCVNFNSQVDFSDVVIMTI